MTELSLENFLTIMTPICIGIAAGFIGLYKITTSLCERVAKTETENKIYHAQPVKNQ